MVLKLNPKQLQKNRKLKQFRKQRRERAYLGQLTCAATWRPKWPAQPTGPSPLSSTSCQKARGHVLATRAPPPPCSGHLLLPRPLLATPRRWPEAPVPSPSLAALSPLPWLSPSSSTERNRRRRPALARPQPPPCSAGASESYASFPSSSSPSHMVPEAPRCRQHRRSPCRSPWIIIVDSGATEHPRLRPRISLPCYEPPHRTSLSPMPISSCNRGLS